MSEVPRARRKLQRALDFGKMDDFTSRMIKEALALMFRETAVRRAPAKYRRITPRLRQSIHRLAQTDMTMSEIAQAVGVRSQGRISEVLNRKR
jgi:transcriptional regulator GlxA family with amidase domain